MIGRVFCCSVHVAGAPRVMRPRIYLTTYRYLTPMTTMLTQSDDALANERRQAIDALLGDTRRIIGEEGVTRASLAAVSDLLLGLATRRSLFTAADFPPPQPDSGDTSVRYRLNPGENGFALYLNSLLPGKTSIPHNHDTWAVIAALDGAELNRVYRRVDDGTDPERAALEVDREVVVQPGVPIAFLPDDIHSIHVGGATPTLHFHLYGCPLDTLTGRLGFELDTGRVVRYNAVHMQRGVQAVG
jgi:predicted metal-dependent enzyme (double-stranded beta helix superfamily)